MEAPTPDYRRRFFELYREKKKACHVRGTPLEERTLRAAVAFWGQTSQILSSSPPKRGCSPKKG